MRLLRQAFKRRSRQVSVPAPTRGWNTADPLASMDPLYAPILINWYPREGELELRGGSNNWATGLGATVRSLFSYAPESGSQKFYGATNAGIYDCTAGGAVGAAVIAVTDGDFSVVNFTNSAGNHFIQCFNGVDTIKQYNGAAWSSISGAITGVTTSDLIQGWVFKRRIWSVKKNTASIGYLPVDSIAGAWSEFPLGSLLKRGGRIVAGTSWTIDGGDGADDLMAVISSEGEVLVYQGTNPDSASSFSLIGSYYVGKPLSKHCFQKLGGDVAVLTQRGVFPLSAALSSADISASTAMSRKIAPTWAQFALARGFVSGWQAAVFPTKEALMVNCPSPESGDPTQFVVNLTTGAWTSFREWSAQSVASFGDELYYGDASGNVVHCWASDVHADKGSDIVAQGEQAYSYFQMQGLLKQIKLLRALLLYDSGVEVQTGIGVDFQAPDHFSVSPRDVTNISAVWDVSLWDISYWLPQSYRDRSWRHVAHRPGYALAFVLQIATKYANVSWSGTDFVLEAGSGLG
jgi:hypothetical protein